MKALLAKTKVRVLAIEGTSEEWYAFARAVLQDGSTINCEEVADPTPSDMSLLRLIVAQKPEGKVIFVPRDDGTCLIEGDLEHLELLSSDAEALAREYRNYEHIHLEYIDPEFYIGEQDYGVILMNCDP